MKKGFSLLEVMIVISILSVLTLFTTQTIRQSLQNKEKIQAQVDQFSTVRDALKLIERDINMAFHYNDIEKELLTQSLSKKTTTPSNPANPNDPLNDPFNDPLNNPAQDLNSNPALAKKFKDRVDPRTDFIGEPEKLNFVTMNGAQLMKNAPVADFAEVGYEVRTCRSLETDKSTNCLWRRQASFADEDVKKGGDDTALLEDVTEFKLKYIGKGKQDWVTTWDSTENGGDSVTKNNFPEAVEISLTVVSEKYKKKKISMQIVAPIHFPNNKEKK